MSNSLTITALPAFADNYLWLMSRGASAAVVDPGDAQPVLDALRQRGLRLDAILATHHHGDHVGGINALLAAREVHGRANLPVYGPADESIPGRTLSLSDGDRIEVLDVSFEVIAVPGHTLGHIAYYASSLDALFCGDTLFAGGCGRLFEGSPSQMYRSLKRLRALPPQTRVFCAHEYTLANLRFASAVEPDNQRLQARLKHVQTQRQCGESTVPSTLAEEIATNPFLRSGEVAVRIAAMNREGLSQKEFGDDELAVFTAIRKWKDAYKQDVAP